MAKRWAEIASPWGPLRRRRWDNVDHLLIRKPTTLCVYVHDDSESEKMQSPSTKVQTCITKQYYTSMSMDRMWLKIGRQCHEKL